jgi:hypothetical protein
VDRTWPPQARHLEPVAEETPEPVMKAESEHAGEATAGTGQAEVEAHEYPGMKLARAVEDSGHPDQDGGPAADSGAPRQPAKTEPSQAGEPAKERKPASVGKPGAPGDSHHLR